MTRTKAMRILRRMIAETPSSNVERIAHLQIRLAQWQRQA